MHVQFRSADWAALSWSLESNIGYKSIDRILYLTFAILFNVESCQGKQVVI